MVLSESPAFCMRQILVRAGLQKPHWPADIIQLASSVQLPHWHEMCRATRRTSSLVICDSVCARHSPVTMSASRLLFNRRMLPRDTDYLRPRILALHLARHQRHQRAKNQSESTDPDPRNQGKYVGLNHRAIAIHTRKIEVQVLV